MGDKYFRRILIVLWLIISALLGFYLPTLPFIKELSHEYLGIKEVKIIGTKRLPENAIKSYLATQNWFLLDEKSLKNYLLNFSFIKDVKIEKESLGKIVIRVKERKPIAKTKIDGTLYLVGEDGKLMEKDYFKDVDLKKLPLVIYNGKVYEAYKVALVKKIEDTLGKNFKIKKYIIYRSKIVAVLDNKNNTNLAFNVDNIDDNLKKVKEFQANENLGKFKSIDFSFQSSVIVKGENKEWEKESH